MRIRASFIAFVVCTTVFVPFSHADVVITGDVAAGAGQLTFTDDINFNITSSTDRIGSIVFDEWTTSDGHRNFTVPSLSGDLTAFAYSINGVEATGQFWLFDNYNETQGDATANDGLLFLNFGLPAAVDDTFTVLAGTYDLSFSVPLFNPDLNDSSFSGDTFLVDSDYNRISDLGVSVPEPATVSFCLAGLIGLICRRRRV